MGIYNGAVITSTGQALLAQSVAGSELKFTTIKTSNYVYPAGTSLADLTTLTGIKQSKNITGATVYNSRVIKVSAMVDNAGVTAEYSINTIGVYATVGTAAEQLFAVITAQEADKMPAFNSRPYSYIYDMNMTMQGAVNITVTVNNAGFVNINDLNNALDGVNDSITDLDETVNGRIDALSSSVDTRISALNDALGTTNTNLNNTVMNRDAVNVVMGYETSSFGTPEGTCSTYMSGAATQKPAGAVSYGNMFQMRSPYSVHPASSGAVYSQLYIDTGANIYVRAFNNGAWTSWKKVTTTNV